MIILKKNTETNEYKCLSNLIFMYIRKYNDKFVKETNLGKI